jgi:hypothetical protein
MMETEKYRFYVLVHSHLSTMQKGVQAAHCVATLVERTISGAQKISHEAYQSVMQWAREDRTLIILDGGNSDDLYSFADFLVATKCKFPRAIFYEDQKTMCGMMTAVGIVVPESFMIEEEQRAMQFDSPNMIWEAIHSRHLAR